MGFLGPIYHVNPKGDIPSVEDLPQAPDAAFIAVNRHAAVGVARSLSTMGAGGAICFASGFEEAGAEGADLQSALLEAAGDALARPQLLWRGKLPGWRGLWPDVHGGKRQENRGGPHHPILQCSYQHVHAAAGPALAYLIAAGNGAQVGLPQLIAAMDSTRV